MILLKGTSAAFNYTYGPAMIYRGPSTIDLIYRQGEPVVVVADEIPMDELRRIELTRVRGFVFEKGSAIDDDLYNFLVTEKRAAVIACEGAMTYICEGDMLAVDGTRGFVGVNPTPEVLDAFQRDRALGPPDDRTLMMQKVARAMLDGLAKERAEKEAKGEPVPKTGEVMTVAEAKAASAAQPGIIYQLLSGLPLPNSPTAGDGHHHPHGPEDGHGHDDGRDAHDDEPPDEPKRDRGQSGRSRRPPPPAS